MSLKRFGMLSDGSDKLFAQWQGPYTIKRKVSPVTLEIDMSICTINAQVNMSVMNVA